MLELGLRGSRLLVFAVVYRYSGEGKGEYYGSLDYIAEWCGISRAQASLILRDLTNEGILEKIAAKDRPHYRIMADVWKTKRLENQMPSLEIQMPSLENQTTSDNRVDNKADNRDIPVVLPRTREKLTFGDYVLLTEEEHAKLVQRFGAEDTARMIEILDGYLANPKQRKRYESHYKVIPGWPHDRLEEEKLRQQRLKNAQEAAQRVKQPQAPVTHYADLAEIDARRKAIEDKYKN